MTADRWFQTSGDEYWAQAQRPLVCLVFLVPLLLFYEAGVLWLGGSRAALLRNGADFWMREWLEAVGWEHTFLLPALVAVFLFTWHLWGKYPWQVTGDTLAGMFAESLLFAFFLVLLGQLQHLAFQHWSDPSLLALKHRMAVARVVSYVGAGIYEEVLFRLCLLPLGYLVFRLLLLPPRWAAGSAVVSSSLLFAAAHYVGTTANEFSAFTFTFRAFAGAFFAGLFLLRGFGITVGCHAAYDVLVGSLLVE